MVNEMKTIWKAYVSKAWRTIRIACTIVVAVLLSVVNKPAFGQVQQPDMILRVHGNSTATNPDGSTWNAAYPFLQDALSRADFEIVNDPDVETVEIWVAGSSEDWGEPGDANNPSNWRWNWYTPDRGNGFNQGTRTYSFDLANNVRILGGFKSGDDEESDRDPETNITVLSGDLDKDDPKDPRDLDNDSNWTGSFNEYSDNTRVIVLTYDATPTSVLDGFTIRNTGTVTYLLT